METAPPREIRFEDYLTIASRNWWLFLITLLFAVLVALLKNDLSPPSYEASTKLWAQTDQPQTPLLQRPANDAIDRNAVLHTYREIILTRTIVAQAIEALRAEGAYVPLPAHRPKILSLFSPTQSQNRTEQGDLTLDMWYSHVVQDLVANRLEAEVARDGNVITITVRERTPERSQAVSNRLAEVFLQFIETNEQAQMQAVENLSAATSSVIQRQLEDAEAALQEFQTLNQTIDLDAEAEMFIRNIGALELDEKRLTQELAGAKARLDVLNGKLTEIREKVVTAEVTTDNPNVVRLRRDLQEYRVRLAELETKYPNHEHPEITWLRTRIRGTETEISYEDETRLSSQTTSLNPVYQGLEQQAIGALGDVQRLETQLTALRQTIEAYHASISEWPEKQLQLARLMRDISLKKELHTQLEKARGEASVVRAATVGNVQLLEAAERPEKPVSPRKGLNLLLGVLGGIGLGVGLMLAKAQRDNRYTSIAEARRDMARLQVAFLANLPRMPHPLACHVSPQSASAEVFRLLRTKLSARNGGNAPKTILVTSAGVGEGQSVVAANLAIAFAQTGVNVLLVDANMRQPAQHRLFSMLDDERAFSNSPGLRDILASQHHLENAVRETGVAHLYLLPSGDIPHNPAELLESAAVQQFVGAAHQAYDCVIFDTPSANRFADAPALCKSSDAVLYVFDIAQSRRTELLEGIEHLTQAGAQKIAVVSNAAKNRRWKRRKSKSAAK